MIYSFGEFELDPEAYELRSRQHGPLAVEPQVLELLAYLVAHRDRVVSKEELLAEVWEGRFVSESALTRCVYQARRALGDDSPETPLIRTVVGRGYRFAAAVEERRPAAGQASDLAAESTAAPPHRLRRSLAVATAIFLVLVAIAVTVWRTRAPAGSGRGATAAADASVEVALLPISVSGPGPQLPLLALSLTDLLWARLGSVPGILVRSPETTAEAVAAAGGPAGFAIRGPPAALLRGSLEASPGGEKAILRIALVETGAAGRLEETPVGGSFELPIPKGAIQLPEFVRVRDAVVESLLDRLLPAVVLPGEAAPDAEAYRLYLAARQRLQAQHCDDAALAMIERALALDPRQALAWYLLASASYSQVWACGADASHFERALAATRRAAELAPHLLEGQMLESTILVETGRIEEAYRLLRDLAAEHPARAELRFEPAYPLRYAGFLVPAERLVREGLELDPLYISTASTGMTPNVFLYRNDLDGFLRHLPDSRSAYHLYYRGFVELLRGHEAAARAALAPAFREHPATVFGRLAQALLSLLDGDTEAAASIVRQVAHQRRELGAVDGEITYKQAQILALAGDSEGALEQLALAVEQGFFCLPYLATDPALAGLRSEPAYGWILTDARRRHLEFAERFGLAPETTRLKR